MKIGTDLRFPIAVTLAWGLLTVGLFWQWIGRYLRPVPPPPGMTDTHPERRPLTPVRTLHPDSGDMTLYSGQPVTVLNFWSPDCPCSRFMERHVQHLVREYGRQGVRFVTIIADPATETARRLALNAWHNRDIATPALIDSDGRQARLFGVWAAPAAVVLDEQARVIYVGAYNVARYCASRRTAYAEQAIQAALRQETPLHARLPFYGCRLPSP